MEKGVLKMGKRAFRRIFLSRFVFSVFVFSVFVFGSFVVRGLGPSLGFADQHLISPSSAEAISSPRVATHEICNTDHANVRDEFLNVIGLAKEGDKITPSLEAQEGFGAFFRRVYFHATPKGWAWIAARFLCPVIHVPHGERRIFVDTQLNRTVFYRGGVLVREWNSGTARSGKITPKGEFRILEKDMCPEYYGDGTKYVPGCVDENPLGTRALWFESTIYGLHGTNQPWLIEEGTTAAERHLSAGCVRNNNLDIEWLYEQVQVGDRITVY
jgi:hypothetical protein